LLQTALDEGKEVALPAFDPLIEAYGARRIERPGSDLSTGRYGIREPSQGCLNVPLQRLDLVLVPGLGFTSDGARIGRGAGFYDRLLSGTNAIRFGVGLDIQIVPQLPVEAHDLPMDYVLTPSGIHEGPVRRA
jgi:5-formyltetrahydrofolate cyclo-ligase